MGARRLKPQATSTKPLLGLGGATSAAARPVSGASGAQGSELPVSQVSFHRLVDEVRRPHRRALPRQRGDVRPGGPQCAVQGAKFGLATVVGNALRRQVIGGRAGRAGVARAIPSPELSLAGGEGYGGLGKGCGSTGRRPRLGKAQGSFGLKLLLLFDSDRVGELHFNLVRMGLPPLPATTTVARHKSLHFRARQGG